jgi:hypothetical protein
LATQEDWVQNDDIRDRVGVAPIEGKLVQHRLRWFGHIQRMPLEASVHSGRLKHAHNVKRGRGRPNLTWVESVKKHAHNVKRGQDRPNFTWEESVKRDLKKWNVTKELTMDRGAWKLPMHVREP